MSNKKTYKVDSDITIAKTIDTSVYIDNKVFEVIVKEVFEHSWHFVGDVSDFPESTWIRPIYIMPGVIDESLMVVRDQDHYYCQSNVCTHRGNLIVTHPGSYPMLRCGYHGRVFDRNGQMLHMPEFKEVHNFPCKEDHLVSLPLFKLGPLLFAHLDTEADADVFFKEVVDRISFIDLGRLARYDEYCRDYEIEANWALYVENYLEGFHIPFVHDSLAKELNFSDYETEIFYPYANLQLGIGKLDENTFDIPQGHVDYGQSVSAYYFWIFPGLMLNFYPWGLSLNVVTPISPGRTKISFITYISDMDKYNKGAGSDLHRVEMEDEAIVL
jgi:choline monooxygenase